MVTIKTGFYDVDSWIELQKKHFPEKDIIDFIKAIELAKTYYTGHKFYPVDTDLLMHAITCAATVAELNLYADAVCATILFALPKYSNLWRSELKAFDSNVSVLIDGIRQISHIRRLGALADVENEVEKRTQIEVMRKMLLAMASDIRIILIVLVGRGELMLNLESCHDPKMRLKIANETVEIFSPIASRLGVWQIKWELEDLSFKYLQSNEYYQIAKLLDETRIERLKYIDEIKQFLSMQMEQGGIINYQVSGRAKHIYSIWKKMNKKNYRFQDLYDICALRVLVPEVKDCYTVLGIVHTQYSPIIGEFDDYIMTPKKNNYQSLHTCVLALDGKAIEIQIRTFAMHDHAEYGVAAHWRYKEMNEKGIGYNAAFAEKLAWLRQILDWRDELTKREDTADIFKNEIFNDTIYTMTPNGKIIPLPQGSTPIDFAYHVHSNVGHKCRGAKVDGQIVPLYTVLQNGQSVEIITVKDGMPSINWLHDGYVKSAKAVGHIRRYIRDQNQEEFLVAGVEIFERELTKFHSSIRPTHADVVSRLNYENEKKLCVDLGRGDLTPSTIKLVAQKIVDKATTIATSKEITPENFELVPDYIKKNRQQRLSRILVGGISGIVTNLAKCCKPIPRDAIMGFITHGKGVTIHRSTCYEFNHQARQSAGKVVNVEWGDNIQGEMFNADLEVIAHDRSGLLRDLTDLFSIEKLSISGLRTFCKNNKAFMVFTLQINSDTFYFTGLISKIYLIHGVIHVARK